MCGFAGFVDFTRRAGDEALRSTALGMADALAHRGPDDSGAWADADAGVALGFRRLSIVDLSPEGHQPMRSAGGRFTVAFNGEIYNHRRVRDELGPYPFRGHSDTEVLLAAVERWGLEGAVGRFVGMFAFALWDGRERRLHLVRDRVGEKPLYYGRSGDVFLFGSELKALRRHPAFRAEVDRDALALYLRHGYIPAPYSIHRDIGKLSPGTILTLDASEPGRAPAVSAYWSAREAAEAGAARPFEGSEGEAADALDGLIRDAVGDQMVADVPVGAFLSGGIDSTTVVAVMQALSPRPVRSFTIGFHEDGYDEAAHARAVARHLGTDHTELYVTADEALAVIPGLPDLYDEPFADPSQIPTFLVARLARREVTVSLSGDGGDELFGGYDRYFAAEAIRGRLGRVPGGVRRGAARAARLVPAAGWDRAFRALGPVTPGVLRGRLSGDRVHKLAGFASAVGPDDLYHRLVSEWADPCRLVAGASEPVTPWTDRAPRAEVGGFFRRMMLVDLMTYLPDDILVKVDRASMGVSLESRAPLLDHRVVEFAARLPIGMNVRGGRGKCLLRRVLDRYVPRALVDRPKMGFGVPVGSWLRGPLRAWADDLLDEQRLRADGYLDPRPVREAWSEHTSGRRDRQQRLWNVLMFQSWLDGQARSGRRPSATHPEATLPCTS